MTTIDDIIASLNPKTQEKVYLAQEAKLTRLPLASIGINRAIGGGIGYKRQTVLWGNKSAGKSALCLQTVAIAQQQGKTCAWIDAEKSYDEGWASRLGVDNSQLILSTIGSISHMSEICSDLMQRGIDVIVIDSITSLLPNSYFDGDEIKDFDNTSQIGQFSKDLGKAINILTYRNQKTALVLISQVRTDLGGYHASLKPTGGKALEHSASTSIKLWSSTSTEDGIKGEITNGDLIINDIVGRKVRWTIDKNKIGPPSGTGEYGFIYKGNQVGIDTATEVIDLGVALGKIEKGGAWYTVLGEKVQGKDKAAQVLRENPTEFEQLIKELTSD